jgi:hypothetical protein
MPSGKLLNSLNYILTKIFMAQNNRFFKELKKNLKPDVHAKRFVQELKDHIEDNSAEEKLRGKHHSSVHELGDPQKLAFFYRFCRKRNSYWFILLMSAMVNSFFLLILTLALLNEDGVPAGALPFFVALVLAILANFSAWKFPKAGGIFTIINAAILFIGVQISAAQFQPDDPVFGILGGLQYGLPLLLVGFLFYRYGKTQELEASNLDISKI